MRLHTIPKISLGSWAFSFGPFEADPWSWERFVDYTAEHGYDGVEINAVPPHPHPDLYDTAAKRRELMARLGDRGLGVSGYAVNGHLPDLEAAPPALAGPRQFVATLRPYLRFCSDAGIGALRLDTASPPEPLAAATYEARFANAVRCLQALAAAAADHGVTLMWEFEPGFWLNKPSEVVRLHDAVGHPNFKLLFDTSHAYMGAVVGSRHTGAPETLPGGAVSARLGAFIIFVVTEDAMAKKKLNVAIIGYGFMGRAHSNAYRTVGNFFDLEYEPVMKVASARRQDQLEAFAANWGWQETDTDWRRVVERPDVDLVDICAPNHVHLEMGRAAAAAGKMIACEKPLAMDAAQGRQLVAAVAAAGRPNMVWFNYRRVPAIALAKQIVDEGRIGRVFHYRSRYLQDWTISPDVPQGGNTLWRLDKSVAGSGVTGDLLAHCGVRRRAAGRGRTALGRPVSRLILPWSTRAARRGTRG